MGERKVLNKHYPPDFDPAKIPRRKQPRNQQMKVRMMLPMTICCCTCGTYIDRGTKFNSRKEDVVGETYRGIIKLYRFYIKCPKCSIEITFKTDPQNSDYTVESSASRKFEHWRKYIEKLEEYKKKRLAEERGDAMKSLENRTLDSKREMDVIAGLEEMKSMNSRHATVSVDEMLEALQRSTKEKQLEEEDEVLVKSLFKELLEARELIALRRIDDNDLDDYEDLDLFPFEIERAPGGAPKRRKIIEEHSNPTVYLTSLDTSTNRGNGGVCDASNDGKVIFKSYTIVKKPSSDSKKIETQEKQLSVVMEEKEKQDVIGNGLQALCQYASDEETDDD